MPATDGEIVSLREYVDKLFDVYDKRYLDIITTNQSSIRSAMETGFSVQKEAVQTALNAAEKAVNAALLAADRAVTKAEISTEKRFEGVNEFRDTLDDRDRAEKERWSRTEQTLMPRQECTILLRAQSDSIAAIVTRLDKSEGKSGGIHEGWGWAAAAVSLVIAVLAIAAKLLS